MPTDPVQTATYLAFSRTWGAAWRQSPVGKQQLQQRFVRYFRWLSREIEPAVIVEIGAHEGSFSRWARETFPQARVLAFEANPHVHAKYAEELARAGVDYRNQAVGPVTGEIELNLPLEIAGDPRALDSHMASIEIHRDLGESVTVSVPSVRLDDHLSLTADQRVVAWVDVEGANQAVLTSGPGVLDHVDALHIEVERRAMWEDQWLDTDVARHLADHGLVPVARDLQKPRQYNVIYVRASLVERTAVTQRAAGILRS